MIAAGALVGLALMYAFINGYNGSGSLIAALVATGAVGLWRARLMCAAANFVGPFIFGVAVALVVGTGIVEPESMTLASIAAALMAAFGWIVVTSRVGVPSSSSHALVGGLLGGGIAAGGTRVVEVGGLLIVALSLVIAPILGLGLGALAMRLTFQLTRVASPSINEAFRRGQVATSLLLSIGYGASNGQNTMGIIALILFRARLIPRFAIPEWVVAAASFGLALGVALGGQRVIRTVGTRIFRLRPVHGFVAQITASLIVIAAVLLGGPVSLNQVATSAIIGAGAAERLSKVRWEVARMTLYAWIVTLPATTLVAFVLYPLTSLVIPRG